MRSHGFAIAAISMFVLGLATALIPALPPVPAPLLYILAIGLIVAVAAFCIEAEIRAHAE